MAILLLWWWEFKHDSFKGLGRNIDCVGQWIDRISHVSAWTLYVFIFFFSPFLGMMTQFHKVTYIYIYTYICFFNQGLSTDLWVWDRDVYWGYVFFKIVLTGLLTNQASLSRIYVICCQFLLAPVLPSLQDHPKILRGSKFQGNLYVRSGQNSHYLNVIVEWSSTQQWGLYIHQQDFFFKGGMIIRNIGSLDPGTYVDAR